eukprot:TRINITY_DN3580_c0_g1_i4.p2 TRINITY_DN3580_c0_g1~~TRINITY_DN3580_c0_g1_i4.p2  ORF type:complete len:144 (+),score=42.93 TRINITY_DN3580_c0_g1_i4:196-627(+)
MDRDFKAIVSKMPEEVKPRFVALKHLTDRRTKLNNALMRKIDKLERKYEKLFEPWDKKREELVNGLREPEESELGLLKELEAPIESAKSTDIDVEGMKGKKGFPGFWAKAMKNNPVITTYLKDFDMPILELSLIHICRCRRAI